MANMITFFRMAGSILDAVGKQTRRDIHHTVSVDIGTGQSVVAVPGKAVLEILRRRATGKQIPRNARYRCRFLDPPYDCVFNDYGNIDMMNGFDEEQHRRLAADFRNLSCRALMVIGKTPLTEELYGKYIRDALPARWSTASGRAFAFP